MIQIHVFYSGGVQGVGFRYTAYHLATALGVTGWVRNLSDGRVELLAEGEDDKIAQLLTALNDHFHFEIRDQQVERLSASGALKKFSILH